MTKSTDTTKILFIDRDGTLISEPLLDQQVDSLEKLQLEPFVIPALLELKKAGFKLTMISNQDGLGTLSFPHHHFEIVQNKLLEIFGGQGIIFDDIKICPHFHHENCSCRKPKLGLVLDYLQNRRFDPQHSYVIGDRPTDMELATQMGIVGILYNKKNSWPKITRHLLSQGRQAQIERITNETKVKVIVNLDRPEPIAIETGIDFFNHMLEQLAKHGGFSLKLRANGDLNVDEHHTVEDVALSFGTAIRQALGDKLGIARYGFLLPMDESLTQVALDLSGRAYLVFNGHFNREKVGHLSTELVSHFFRSLAESLQATINIEVKGENAHHMIESIFKCVGRALRMAIRRERRADGSHNYELPTTKGRL